MLSKSPHQIFCYFYFLPANSSLFSEINYCKFKIGIKHTHTYNVWKKLPLTGWMLWDEIELIWCQLLYLWMLVFTFRWFVATFHEHETGNRVTNNEPRHTILHTCNWWRASQTIHSLLSRITVSVEEEEENKRKKEKNPRLNFSVNCTIFFFPIFFFSQFLFLARSFFTIFSHGIQLAYVILLLFL